MINITVADYKSISGLLRFLLVVFPVLSLTICLFVSGLALLLAYIATMINITVDDYKSISGWDCLVCTPSCIALYTVF